MARRGVPCNGLEKQQQQQERWIVAVVEQARVVVGEQPLVSRRPRELDAFELVSPERGPEQRGAFVERAFARVAVVVVAVARELEPEPLVGQLRQQQRRVGPNDIPST